MDLELAIVNTWNRAKMENDTIYLATDGSKISNGFVTSSCVGTKGIAIKFQRGFEVIDGEFMGFMIACVIQWNFQSKTE